MLRAKTILVAIIALSAHAQCAIAEEIFGLTESGKLVRFDSSDPGTLLSSATVTGLNAGESLVSIDFRSGTGRLFGIGSQSRVYTIDPSTSVATSVAGPLSTLLSGTKFDIDISPTNDVIRVVSDTTQFMRVSPQDGTLQSNDTALTYAFTDSNSGSTPHVVGLAHSSNFVSAQSTFAFAIDSNEDTLIRIGGTNGTPSVNTGSLFTLGGLGVDTSDFVGFDISGLSYIAFASLTVSGETTSGLYQIDLGNGAASLLGVIGGGERLLAISAVTTPVSFLWGTSTGQLRLFAVEAPGTTLRVLNITGLQGGEDVEGIDFRPADDALYLLGSTSRLYTVNLTTGAATQVGSSGAFTLNGSNFGFDVNPLADRIRVVSDTEQNLRLNPTTGALSATDTNLAYANGDVNFGDNPSVVGVGYTNNVNGATSTTLYGIDSAEDVLFTQNPPNNGTLNTVGALGVDFGTSSGFDVANGASYGLANNGNNLYFVNLTTGATLLAGTMTGSMIDIAAAPVSTYSLSATTASVGEGDGSATLTVSRTGSTSGTSYVFYTTTVGTAVADDFTVASGLLTFVDGETSKTISVEIEDDLLLEAAETFTVTLSTVLGGAIGVNTSSTVTINDNDDTDGDGFSDSVENAAGSTPTDATSTPFEGAGPGTPLSVTNPRLQVDLDFLNSNRDSITLGGSVSLGRSFKVRGKRLTFDIGGVVRSVTLSKAGKGRGDGVKVSLRTTGANRAFTIRMTRGAFQDAFMDEGLENETVSQSATVAVGLYINNTVFNASEVGTYTANRDTSGRFR